MLTSMQELSAQLQKEAPGEIFQKIQKYAALAASTVLAMQMSISEVAAKEDSLGPQVNKCETNISQNNAEKTSKQYLLKSEKLKDKGRLQNEDR